MATSNILCSPGTQMPTKPKSSPSCSTTMTLCQQGPQNNNNRMCATRRIVASRCVLIIIDTENEPRKRNSRQRHKYILRLGEYECCLNTPCAPGSSFMLPHQGRHSHEPKVADVVLFAGPQYRPSRGPGVVLNITIVAVRPVGCETQLHSHAIPAEHGLDARVHRKVIQCAAASALHQH